MDGEVGLRRKRDGLSTLGLGRGLRTPRVVLGDLDVDVAALDQVVRVDIVGPREERIELSRDVLESEIDRCRALVQ